MENERPARRFRDANRTGGPNFGHEATLVIVASLSQHGDSRDAGGSSMQHKTSLSVTSSLWIPYRGGVSRGRSITARCI